MLNVHDQEQLTKAAHSASFLVQELRELVDTANPLLADIAIEVLQQAVQLELRLSRLETLARTTETT